MLKKALSVVMLVLGAPTGALAFDLLGVVPCIASSTATAQSWCLAPELKAGRKVSILGLPKCTGTTGPPTTIIGDEDERYTGTSLILKCKVSLEDKLALLDTQVSKYRDVPVKNIVNSPAVLRFEKQIAATALFKKRNAELDAANGFPADPEWSGVEIRFPSRTLYALRSERIGWPSYLVGNGFMRLWGEDGFGYKVDRAFELNGTEVIQVSFCVDATDNCGGGFALGPDFKSSTDPKD